MVVPAPPLTAMLLLKDTSAAFIALLFWGNRYTWFLRQASNAQGPSVWNFPEAGTNIHEGPR
ncbi:hypothetical protein DV515_00008266 [Chloebia gouldiae]|uniref:Uncharacterized protein n=1 Tax=Chloebia gouldiae TaxID=44316 RepID=A0A3L8SFN1_CHLGU|nr:hypothetical protein DV515_00008266 [Chloebia gouldiae]